jgi:hypothetical protein
MVEKQNFYVSRIDAIAATLPFGNGFAERERLTANPQGRRRGAKSYIKLTG